MPVDHYLLVSGSRIANEAGNTLALLDQSTGKAGWYYKVPKDTYFSGGNNIPTINSGVIYYNNYDAVFAYSLPEDKLLWKAEIPYVGASILVDENSAFVLADTHGSTGHPVALKALDKTSGGIRWSKTFGNDQYVNGNLLASGTHIFVTARSNYAPLKAYVYIFNRTDGNMEQAVAIDYEQYGIINAPMSGLYIDGKFFLTIGDSTLVINEGNGQVIQNFSSSKAIAAPTPMPARGLVGFDSKGHVLPSKMAFDDNSLFYVNQEGKLASRRVSDGKVLWEYLLPEQAKTPPIVTDSLVYIATESSLYGIDKRTGSVIWKYKLDNGTGSGLSAMNGKIYFISAAHRLNVLQ